MVQSGLELNFVPFLHQTITVVLNSVGGGEQLGNVISSHVISVMMLQELFGPDV